MHVLRVVVPFVVICTSALGQSVDVSRWLGAHAWRNIGPARGGRSVACTGVVGEPMTFYFGGTGGGVWKTTNGGVTWRNISDGAFGTGSVGAIAVAQSDPNVVFVGMGEACVRGNFSHGDGVYRSLDAGKTWEHVGLEDTRQIGDVLIHPRDEQTVFVAALGHVFGPNAQRGVFKSTDGGETWRRVLYVDDRTGAVDLAMDPFNPRIMYAGMWQVRRTPWSLESGGEGSGLYRSRDGGETWEELTNGLPAGIKGKIAISCSAAQRDRVWAIVEAEDGGLFRSDDGGDSWVRVNEDRNLRQRAWYYTHVEADPVEADAVYVMNVQLLRSRDGGRTFESIRVPHGDTHDLWINPDDNRILINSNDGGACVSYDGGVSWSELSNQPTAQFYHVTVDNGYPYRVYGAQQDNSTMSLPHISNPWRWERDWHAVGGGESGYIAVDPRDPDIVYAGSYGGYMTRYDHELGKSRNITVWPENPMGAGVADLEHRFQWTFPIVISPHDPDTLYVGGEVLFRSTDEGASWEIISPDLTTNDKSKQGPSGGPITKDNTSVEYYCTIFSVAESPIEQGLIWAGSDDGLVHVTSDGGKTWTNVTPVGMGDWPMISMIEASPHDADTAYLAVNRYKMDDFRPMVYRTRDRGQTWELIADGIAPDAFVRSVREDPVRPGLLYAATELGVWVSLDAGDSWQSLQLNLPVVPVTDLVVKDDDLVISTQGRSFWILSGLGVLRQIDRMGDEGTLPEDDALVVFEARPAYREGWDRVEIYARVPEDGGVQRVEFRDADGRVLRTLKAGEDLHLEPGMNRVVWDMRLERASRVPGAVGWPPMPPGPRVAPGLYEAVFLDKDGAEAGRSRIEIRHDPRIDTSDEGYRAQFALLREIHAALDDAHDAVNAIRDIRREIDATMARAERAGLDEDLRPMADEIRGVIGEIEEEIIQTRSRSAQDPLNYPVKLNDKIGALAYTVEGDWPPTAQARAVFDRLRERLDAQLERLDDVLLEMVPAFNAKVEQVGVPAVVIEPDDDERE